MSPGPNNSTEFSRNQNGSGNSLKQQISYNATKSKDFNVLNDNNSLKHQISFNTAESKDSNEINENEQTKNNEKFPRLTLDSGIGTNLSSGPNTGNDEQETAFERGFSQFLNNFDPTMISEREFSANSSSEPKISAELSKNQNGSGNSLKHQISYNTTKPKDFNELNDNNSLKHQISFNTAESKDSNEINENEYTKNNEKFPRSTPDSGTKTNLSSRPNTGDDEQEKAFERGFSQFFDSGSGTNLYSRPNTGQDEQEKDSERDPATFHEHKCGANSSSGPRLSTEFSRNQNGSGNSLKGTY